MAASGKSKSSTSTKPKRSRAKPSPTKGEAQPKKRRRSSPSNKKAKADSAKPPGTPAPSSVLIVDNGGDTLKYGWLESHEEPLRLPNVTARLKHQWTILAGDELREKVQNPNQMYSITRSTERGIVTNLGNQVQVWKRMLDLLGVVIPNLDSEAAQAFGWKVARTNKAAKQQKQQPQPVISETPKIPASLVAILLLVPPHCPRSVLDQMMYVWMEDFGVSHVGFATSQICATQPDPDLMTGCLVDLGWSATHIVPTFRGTTIVSEDKEGRARCPIRRVPLGGRHLVNVWKYYASYRQWNLMDQEWILRDVFEKLAYVTLNSKEIDEARQKPHGRRPFDRNFVLPDYQSTHQGHVELTGPLKREAEELKRKQLQEQEEQAHQEEEDDGDFEDDKMEEDVELEMDDDEINDGASSENGPDEASAGDEDKKKQDSENEDGEESNKKTKKKKSTKMKRKRKRLNNNADDDDADDDSGDDSEDDNKDMLRQRLLRQKQEEERRHRELEAEQQVLTVSVERFTVPEVLFKPSDAGLPLEMAGLAHSIVQSIKTCPRYLQPALFRSIQLTGGIAQLPNLLERLQRELRALTPTEFELKVSKAKKPVEQAWLGARDWVRKSPYTKWSVSRSEWEASQKRKAWMKFLVSNGGILA